MTCTEAADLYAAGLVIYEISFSKLKDTSEQNRPADSVGRFNRNRKNFCQQQSQDNQNRKAQNEIGVEPELGPMPDLESLLPSFPQLHKPIRELLVCMLRCEPAQRCRVDEAKGIVVRLLDHVGIDPQRIFQRPGSKIPDRASGLPIEDQQDGRPEIAELIGDETRVRVRNVTEYPEPDL